jgi:CspA family cold shock protein
MTKKVLDSFHKARTEAIFFVHASGLIDEIRENDRVEYDVEEGKKGLNAINVKVI